MSTDKESNNDDLYEVPSLQLSTEIPRSHVFNESNVNLSQNEPVIPTITGQTLRFVCPPKNINKIENSTLKRAFKRSVQLTFDNEGKVLYNKYDHAFKIVVELFEDLQKTFQIPLRKHIVTDAIDILYHFYKNTGSIEQENHVSSSIARIHHAGAVLYIAGTRYDPRLNKKMILQVINERTYTKRDNVYHLNAPEFCAKNAADIVRIIIEEDEYKRAIKFIEQNGSKSRKQPELVLFLKQKGVTFRVMKTLITLSQLNSAIWNLDPYHSELSYASLVYNYLALLKNSVEDKYFLYNVTMQLIRVTTDSNQLRRKKVIAALHLAFLLLNKTDFPDWVHRYKNAKASKHLEEILNITLYTNKYTLHDPPHQLLTTLNHAFTHLPTEGVFIPKNSDDFSKRIFFVIEHVPRSNNIQLREVRWNPNRMRYDKHGICIHKFERCLHYIAKHGYHATTLRKEMNITSGEYVPVSSFLRQMGLLEKTDRSYHYRLNRTYPAVIRHIRYHNIMDSIDLIYQSDLIRARIFTDHRNFCYTFHDGKKIYLSKALINDIYRRLPTEWVPLTSIASGAPTSQMLKKRILGYLELIQMVESKTENSITYYRQLPILNDHDHLITLFLPLIRERFPMGVTSESYKGRIYSFEDGKLKCEGVKEWTLECHILDCLYDIGVVLQKRQENLNETGVPKKWIKWLLHKSGVPSELWIEVLHFLSAISAIQKHGTRYIVEFIHNDDCQFTFYKRLRKFFGFRDDYA